MLALVVEKNRYVSGWELSINSSIDLKQGEL